MSVASSTVVGMGGIRVIKGPEQISCLDLGSCIAVCALDPTAHVGGIVHVMLSASNADDPFDRPGRFADRGVEALLENMEREGAERSRIVVAIVGGSQLLGFENSCSRGLDIGARNAVAVRANLVKAGIRIVAEDTGGNLGRTVTMTNNTGDVVVRTVASGERLLCNLRG